MLFAYRVRRRAPVLIIFIGLLAAGCEQTGDLKVENLSAGGLSGDVEGQRFSCSSFGSDEVSVDLGRNWSLVGTKEENVLVRGEGDCVWEFEAQTTVNSDEARGVAIVGDAGFIEVCNDVSQSLDIFLTSCSSSSWGTRDARLSSGNCTTFKVTYGCWSLRAGGEQGVATRNGIIIDDCPGARWTVLPGGGSSSLTTRLEEVRKSQTPEEPVNPQSVVANDGPLSPRVARIR